MQQSLFRRSAVTLAVAACLGWGAASVAQTTTPAAQPAGPQATLVADAHGVHHRGRHAMHQRSKHYRGKHHRAGARGHHARNKSARHGGKHHRYGSSRRAPAVMVIPGFGGVGQHVVDQLSLTDSQQSLLEQAQESTKKVRLSWSDKPQKTLSTMDPRARLEARQEHREARARARDTSTEHWLELWDSLDDKQQSFLSGVFAERASRQMQRRQSTGTSQGTD